jgi:hypothetical protein
MLSARSLAMSSADSSYVDVDVDVDVDGDDDGDGDGDCYGDDAGNVIDGQLLGKCDPKITKNN